MQESFMNSVYSHDIEEATPAKEFYLWALEHTRLCQIYIAELDNIIKKNLNEKIEDSLLHGKHLLNSLNGKAHSKPLIPASGINRFNQPKELLNTREIISKNNHSPFRAELGTSCNLKTIPLPSKTYLKKKNPTQ